jgi:hypothetical protein
MTRLLAVDFRGAEILGIELDGTAYVVFKPVVEAIGLSWHGQLERVKRDQVLSEGIRMIRIPFMRGGDQDAVALRLDRLHGWLFSIDSSRVKEEIRELVHIYQRECYDVLYRHFFGDRDQLRKEANDTTSLHLRLCTESRHIHGIRAADELWKKLGLPRVPAMDEAHRDLFSWQSDSSSFSSEPQLPHEQSPTAVPA